MITIQGKGVSKGIAKGPLYFFQRSDTTVTLKVVSDPKQYEKRRKDTYYEIEQKNFEPGPGTGYGPEPGHHRVCRRGWGNHH